MKEGDPPGLGASSSIAPMVLTGRRLQHHGRMPGKVPVAFQLQWGSAAAPITRIFTGPKNFPRFILRRREQGFGSRTKIEGRARDSARASDRRNWRRRKRSTKASGSKNRAVHSASVLSTKHRLLRGYTQEIAV